MGSFPVLSPENLEQFLREEQEERGEEEIQEEEDKLEEEEIQTDGGDEVEAEIEEETVGDQTSAEEQTEDVESLLDRLRAQVEEEEEPEVQNPLVQPGNVRYFERILEQIDEDEDEIQD